MSSSRLCEKNTGLLWPVHGAEHIRSTGTSGYEVGLVATFGQPGAGSSSGLAWAIRSTHRSVVRVSTLAGASRFSAPLRLPYSMRISDPPRTYDPTAPL